MNRREKTPARGFLLFLVLIFGMVAVGCTEGSENTPGSSGRSDAKTHEHGEEAGNQDTAPHSGTHDEEGEHSSHSDSEPITLSKEAVQRYGLETATAESGQLAGRVTAPGRIEYPPNQKAHISPLVQSRVAETDVSIGDEVDPGDTLATMRSIKLGRARAAVDEAKAEEQVADTNFARLKRLHEQNVVSERRFLKAKGELETARADLQAAKSEMETFGVSSGSGPFYALTADIGGQVVEQHAASGEVKKPSEPLFTVADASEIWVVADVHQEAMRRVETGMKATVVLDAYPARSWSGQVDWVAQQVDGDTRTLPIRVVLDNKGRRLKPGMYADVLMLPKRGEAHALVPVGAIQRVHGRRVVFVPTDKARTYHPVEVEVGAESDGMAEILSGLEPGDEYVSSGAFDLKATATAASRSSSHSH